MIWSGSFVWRELGALNRAPLEWNPKQLASDESLFSKIINSFRILTNSLKNHKSLLFQFIFYPLFYLVITQGWGYSSWTMKSFTLTVKWFRLFFSSFYFIIRNCHSLVWLKLYERSRFEAWILSEEPFFNLLPLRTQSMKKSKVWNYSVRISKGFFVNGLILTGPQIYCGFVIC